MHFYTKMHRSKLYEKEDVDYTNIFANEKLVAIRCFIIRTREEAKFDGTVNVIIHNTETQKDYIGQAHAFTVPYSDNYGKGFFQYWTLDLKTFPEYEFCGSCTITTL